jgi:hypothetical protein
MKRTTMFFIVAMLIGAGVAWSGATAYEMVMSKDEKLCPTVLTALNKDLAELGEIRYATHQATPVIHWHSMKELVSPLESTECEQFRWAKFDINNDGKDALVVKYSVCLDEKLTDELYMFDAGYGGLKDVRDRPEFFKAYRKSGIGSLKLGDYWLTELPTSHEGFGDERIKTELVLTPFRFNGATYLHIDPMMPNEFNVYLHIVTKYTREDLPPPEKRRADPIPHGQSPKGLQDVCYFKMKGTDFRVVERAGDGLVWRP